MPRFVAQGLTEADAKAKPYRLVAQGLTEADAKAKAKELAR